MKSLPVMTPYPRQICHIAVEKLLIINPVPTKKIAMKQSVLMAIKLSIGPTSNPAKFVTTTFIAITKVMAVARPPASFLRCSPNMRP